MKNSSVSPVSLVDPDLEMGPVEATVRAFPMIGIKLEGILQFVESIGGRDGLQGLTTTDVCNRYVIPLTASISASYCDYCAKSTDESFKKVIGTANVFISHAWKYEFVTVVDTLTTYFRGHEDEYYLWFDLFSNNQNGLNEPPPFSWWCDVFMLSIQKIGHVVMVMEPWNDPIPLTRAWCLWEIYCTENTKSKFEVAMSLKSSQQFLATIVDDSDSFIEMLNNVDVRKSEAFNPLDREQIFEVINKSVGFQKLNMLVNERLRNWVVGLVRRYLDGLRSQLQQLQSADKKDVEDIDSQIGFFAMAVIRYRLVLFQILSRQKDVAGLSAEIFEWINLEDYFDLARSSGSYHERRYLKAKSLLYENIANHYANMEPGQSFTPKNPVGEKAQECIDICQELISEDPSNLCRYEDLLFRALREKNRDYVLVLVISFGHGEYVAQSRECLDKHIEKFGEDHKYTLECYSVHTKAMRAVGQYREAEVICSRTLETRKRVLGPYHPDTMESMYVLAELYHWLCDFDNCKRVLRECIDHNIEKFGEDGGITLEAKKLYRSADLRSRNICVRFVYGVGEFGIVTVILCRGIDTRVRWLVCLRIMCSYCSLISLPFEIVQLILYLLLDTVVIALTRCRDKPLTNEVAIARSRRLFIMICLAPCAVIICLPLFVPILCCVFCCAEQCAKGVMGAFKPKSSVARIQPDDDA